MKLYLVTREFGDADPWEGGSEEVDVVFATTDKVKLDDYVSSRNVSPEDVVEMELDKDYWDDDSSDTCVASWWEEGPCYDDPMDI